MHETPRQQAPASEPRWKMWWALALLLVALQLAIGYRVRLSEWQVSPASNTALDEAIQWRHGAMALQYDGPNVEATAVGARKYNVVGHAFVLYSLLGIELSRLMGASPDTLSGGVYVLLVALPLPFIAFGSFRVAVGRSDWAALLSAALIAGTSVAPVLAVCRTGAVYYINHILAVEGLLLIAADLLGRKRIWPAVIGLALAVWSRQMTCLYAVPILLVAWRSRTATAGSAIAESSSGGGRRRLATAIGGVALVAAFPMTLNAVKFGNPLDTGYTRMYGDRTNQISIDGKETFWGVRWFPKHIWAMNVAMPEPDIRQGELFLDASESEGGSIWLTSPILLGVFILAGRWWRDRTARWLMLASFAVVLGLLGYHTTGAHQSGYYRYSLDFVPIWLMVIAPHLTHSRWAPWTIAAAAWGMLYFNLLTW